MEILVDRFLGALPLEGKTVLDVGCGLGFFSERLVERGATVIACDLGEALVRRTVRRCSCRGIVADALNLRQTLRPASFDIVVSSECIEHTPDPPRALREMIAVLKPGGHLSISTPNLLWYPAVRFATLARLRPFDGYENFSTWNGLRRVLSDEGMQILEEYGLHLFPFQLPLHGLSRWVDHHLQWARALMINICLFARKGDR